MLLRESELIELLGVSRVALWNWRRDGTFPRPIRLTGGRSIAWRVADVEGWLASRPVA